MLKLYLNIQIIDIIKFECYNKKTFVMINLDFNKFKLFISQEYCFI